MRSGSPRSFASDPATDAAAPGRGWCIQIRAAGERATPGAEAGSARPEDPALPATPSIRRLRYFTLTEMVRALASSRLGRFTASTPCS